LHAGQDVLVNRHRERRAGLPEPLAEHLDRHAAAWAGDSTAPADPTWANGRRY
jgi:hypothetical protein